MEDAADDARIAVAVRLYVAGARTRGDRCDLAALLRRFPTHESVVAREFLDLSGAAPHSPFPGVGDSAADLVGGRFAPLFELGRGGQGTVWLAEDRRLGRRVALKRLEARRDVGPVALERFRREAEALSRLRHPGLADVVDAGVDDRVPWIAMRYVEGETLAARFARGAVAAEEVPAFLRLVAATARALHAAHEAGVVHRDVKPANVVAGADGAPVVLDFGLARLDETEAAPTLTAVGDVFGTPAYMAPEQSRGLRVDRRVDVWALGAVLYEGLAGRRPFDGPTREALWNAVREAEPPPLRRASGVSRRDLAAIVATALAKEPDRRYATARAFAEDLERAAEGRSVLARRPGALDRAASFVRRRPRAALAAAGFGVFAAAAALVVLALWGETRRAQSATSRALVDVERLADLRTARLLPEAAEPLWPTTDDAALLGRFDAWIAAADRLVAARATNAALLASLEARLGPASRDAAGEFATDPARDRDRWLRDGLSELVALADALTAPPVADPRLRGAFESETRRRGIAPLPSVDEVRRRRAFAAAVRRTTVEEPAADWSAAAAAATRPPYRPDTVLRPILGLVPLGADPESKLQEFWQPETGARPARDPATGRLRVDGATGIVFVLMPGGRFPYGASEEENGEVRLSTGGFGRIPGRGGADRDVAPFLLSKFETTAPQWSRVMERRGAGAPEALPGESDAPAAWATWIDATRFARRLGGRLPRDDEWEFAARAGGEAAWGAADDVAALQDLANLSRGSDEREGADRFEDVAPVGSFPPNAFGLFDLVGNVAEWTSGTYDPATLENADDRRGLPLRARFVLAAGGGFTDPPEDARVVSRSAQTPEAASPRIGVRVARDL